MNKLVLLSVIVFFALGVAACQEKTAMQEDRDEMVDAVDAFTDKIDEITADDGGRKDMVEAVGDFTDDIEEVTGDLGYETNQTSGTDKLQSNP